MRQQQYEQNEGINPMQMAGSMFSPNKILVESSTMIFIIAFMLFNMVILLYFGRTMTPSQSMLGLVALFLTFVLAGRQYASFR
jgi:flagellar biogenesis protein FliO